jgi:DNA-directed RNA polymerase subunit M/transcription elongation factor TFIIS
MKIKTILSEYRNDFIAIMECEHCGYECSNTNGYHDNYYHTKVIPAMHCPACDKNRAGYTKEQVALQGTKP